MPVSVAPQVLVREPQFDFNVASLIHFVNVGVRRLRHVLRALADFFPDMGYCQGTGMVLSI